PAFPLAREGAPTVGRAGRGQGCQPPLIQRPPERPPGARPPRPPRRVRTPGPPATRRLATCHSQPASPRQGLTTGATLDLRAHRALQGVVARGRRAVTRGNRNQ